MKNIIRKWLGITSIEETINHVTRALENASFESVSKQARWEVKNIIDNEQFIDTVIERIKRKQLSG